MCDKKLCKLRVNKDNCIGCGCCIGSFPDSITFDDDGKAEIISVNDEDIEDILSICPMSAIEEEE